MLTLRLVLLVGLSLAATLLASVPGAQAEVVCYIGPVTIHDGASARSSDVSDIQLTEGWLLCCGNGDPLEDPTLAKDCRYGGYRPNIT